jgi:hypothetical protein
MGARRGGGQGPGGARLTQAWEDGRSGKLGRMRPSLAEA